MNDASWKSLWRVFPVPARATPDASPFRYMFRPDQKSKTARFVHKCDRFEMIAANS